MASYGVEHNQTIGKPSSINFSRSSKCVGNFHPEPYFGLHKRKWPGRITVLNVPQGSRGTLMTWQWYARICSTAMFHGCRQYMHKVKRDVSSRVDAIMFHVEQTTSVRSIQTSVSNDRLNYAWRKQYANASNKQTPGLCKRIKGAIGGEGVSIGLA